MITSKRWLDWTQPQFVSLQRNLRHPSDYQLTQRLGSDMRAAGVQGFTFASARDTEGGRNVGVFTGNAFASLSESGHENWAVWVTREQIEFRSLLQTRAKPWVFHRRQFVRRGALALPAAR